MTAFAAFYGGRPAKYLRDWDIVADYYVAHPDDAMAVYYSRRWHHLERARQRRTARRNRTGRSVGQ